MKSKTKKLDVLAFGAHPDDVELGCAGTLLTLAQQGYAAGIIDLTEGEMASRGTVEERYKEAGESAKILKVVLRQNLKMSDAKIENNEENRNKIIEVVRRYKPTIVFAPNPDDRHPDHIHAGNLVTEGCFFAGLKKILPGIPHYRPAKIVYYMTTYEFNPTFVVDISDQFGEKIKALQSYRSQFYNPDWPGTETFVSSQWFMEALEFRARHFGWLAGVRYGEPFRIREKLALDDIMPILSKSIM
ncbi:MAG: bacillithiol biosynthesis deacetylase BshB1 [Calditrichia bacterium]